MKGSLVKKMLFPRLLFLVGDVAVDTCQLRTRIVVRGIPVHRALPAQRSHCLGMGKMLRISYAYQRGGMHRVMFLNREVSHCYKHEPASQENSQEQCAKA